MRFHITLSMGIESKQIDVNGSLHKAKIIATREMAKDIIQAAWIYDSDMLESVLGQTIATSRSFVCGKTMLGKKWITNHKQMTEQARKAFLDSATVSGDADCDWHYDLNW